LDLVGSVDRIPGEHALESTWQPSIVESADGPENAPFAMSSEMAISRAVSLANESTETPRSIDMISSEARGATGTVSAPSPVETSPEVEVSVAPHASALEPSPEPEPEPAFEPSLKSQTETLPQVVQEAPAPREMHATEVSAASTTPTYAGPAGYANGTGGESHDQAQDEASSPRSDDAPSAAAAVEPPRPSRRGWWQRRFGGAE
jgi:hypothetical protein